jgi:hypothetical protein
MPCYDFSFPDRDGRPVLAIVCQRGSGIRRKRCSGCGALCDRLCDIPVPGQPPGAERATCSAPVCSRCTVRLGDDDVCPAHPVPAEALRCARIPARARR